MDPVRGKNGPGYTGAYFFTIHHNTGPIRETILTRKGTFSHIPGES